jgi:hypothetical protein
MSGPITRCTVWNGGDWHIGLDPLADAQPTLSVDPDADEATITLPGARKSALDHDPVGCPILASNDNGVAYEGEVSEITQQYALDGRRLHIRCEPGSEGPLFVPTASQLPGGTPIP